MILTLEQMQAEYEALIAKNAALQEELQKSQKNLHSLLNELAYIKEQFKLVRKRQFGKSSEASQVKQYTLFDEQEADEVIETITPIDAEQEEVSYKRGKRKPSTGRNIDTSLLLRTQVIHDLSENEKLCECGCQMVLIGEDKSEQIDYIPADLKVIEHVTLKYACKPCEKIKSTKKPKSAIPKCMATNNFISSIIIKKFENHLPLYRQSKIFAGNGIDIPDNTLGNWVCGAADALSPLRDAFISQLSNVHELQVDETPVKILKPDKKGYMWAYHSLNINNRFIFFEYHLSRAAHIVEERLQHFTGCLQTDGYSGYNGMRSNPSIISFGCFDHARRKFVDAIKVSNTNDSGVAGKIFTQINKLYKIEQSVKNKSDDERYLLRQQYAVPILEVIMKLATTASVPPKSAVGKAISYLIAQWDHLIAFAQYPQMPISNILVENQIRPLALGKKNWLFVGNEKSGNQAALLYSLIQSCKINQIHPGRYLTYVLSQAEDLRTGRIKAESLLPQFIDKSLF